jgi:hypothetical protein
MIGALQHVLERALERLFFLMTTYLPALMVGALVLAVAYGMAVFARWLLTRIFKGIALDRFLRQSGISSMLTRSGKLHATPLLAAGVFWLILGIGVLTALSAFDSELSSRMIEGAVLLFPKLVTAALILVGGVWVAQYLGRSALVWAFNEGIPRPRRLAVAVRILIVFAAVVVAADQLDFGRNVFLAAFIMLVGGAALAASLALGLGGREAIRRHLEKELAPPEQQAERSLWNHL